MPDTLPRALELARKARLSGNPMSVQPHTLWEAAQIGPMLDRKYLYRHAMLEAGHIISNATGLPYVVCPECGWRADA